MPKRENNAFKELQPKIPRPSVARLTVTMVDSFHSSTMGMSSAGSPTLAHIIPSHGGLPSAKSGAGGSAHSFTVAAMVS